MTAGYSGTPLAKKLGIRPGDRVGTVRAPEHLETLLADLPGGARLLRLRRGGPPYPVILCFADSLRTLHSELGRAVGQLETAGGLWIAWPKRSSPLASDITESDVRREGLATGLVDNKICAIDTDWSGLRFVVRVDDRPGWEARRSQWS